MHPQTHSALHVGTRTWLFQRATKGHDLAAVGGGDSLHSLKPEWDLSMLYGLVHASVWQREFESFTEQLLPSGIAVKVKVLQTHTQISA